MKHTNNALLMKRDAPQYSTIQSRTEVHEKTQVLTRWKEAASRDGRNDDGLGTDGAAEAESKTWTDEHVEPDAPTRLDSAFDVLGRRMRYS